MKVYEMPLHPQIQKELLLQLVLSIQFIFPLIANFLYIVHNCTNLHFYQFTITIMLYLMVQKLHKVYSTLPEVKIRNTFQFYISVSKIKNVMVSRQQCFYLLIYIVLTGLQISVICSLGYLIIKNPKCKNTNRHYDCICTYCICNMYVDVHISSLFYMKSKQWCLHKVRLYTNKTIYMNEFRL